MAKLATIGRNASVDGVGALLDVGGAGVLRIYSGGPPADPQTAPTGVLLAELPLSNPALGAAASGVGVFNPIADDVSANATGTAGWFRLSSGGASAVIDGTITAGGGGGDIEFNTISFIAGGLVEITSLQLEQPES